MSVHRDCVYQNYVSAHDKPLAPPSIEGFKPREALMSINRGFFCLLEKDRSVIERRISRFFC